MSKTKKDEEPGHPFHEPPKPSSLDEPISGVKPKQIACPICGKTYDTRSEMERHERTTHEALEGHNY